MHKREPVVYTLGYRGGWEPDALRQCLIDLSAVLIDVRYTPYSRWLPQWRKKALHALLGDAYMWVQELGNKAYKAKPARVEIADLERGLARLEPLLAAQRNVLLLCGCPHLATCHLRVVAEAIETRWGIATEPLMPESPALARGLVD